MPSQTTTEKNSTAGVIPATPRRIQAVTVLPDYQLAISFRDGRKGIVDCSAIKTSGNPGIYAPLAVPDCFAQVKIELGVLTWPNGADLDLSCLFDKLTNKNSWLAPFWFYFVRLHIILMH